MGVVGCCDKSQSRIAMHLSQSLRWQSNASGCLLYGTINSSAVYILYSLFIGKEFP